MENQERTEQLVQIPFTITDGPQRHARYAARGACRAADPATRSAAQRPERATRAAALTVRNRDVRNQGRRRVHLGGDGLDGALDRLAHYRDEELAEVIEAALRRHLAAGVTTVRDLGDRRWSVVERRDRAAQSQGDTVYPTIVASGPPITSPRGHCWYMGGEVQGDAALRAAISKRAQRQVDVVKIMPHRDSQSRSGQTVRD
ncbi:MAG: hypothetical protein ACRDRA_09320 [Pseudonocardiaceae bacterium]